MSMEMLDVKFLGRRRRGAQPFRRSGRSREEIPLSFCSAKNGEKKNLVGDDDSLKEAVVEMFLSSARGAADFVASEARNAELAAGRPAGRRLRDLGGELAGHRGGRRRLLVPPCYRDGSGGAVCLPRRHPRPAPGRPCLLGRAGLPGRGRHRRRAVVAGRGRHGFALGPIQAGAGCLWAATASLGTRRWARGFRGPRSSSAWTSSA